MSKCSDLRDIVWGTVCAIRAIFLILPAVVAIAALFGLFAVVTRLPIDLYTSHFAEENSG